MTDAYREGLDRRPANFQPLTPLSYLARSAAVFPDRVAIIQGDDTGFTTSAACDAQPSITTQPVIDGVAYRSGNDDATTLPQLLYSSDPGSAINEGDAAGDREDVSVVRCDFSSARRDQSQWSVPAPGSDKRTPNAANDSVCE